MPRKSPTIDETARFFSKVNSGGVCWEWEGSQTPDGYGRHWIARKGPMAHRWIWEHLVGPIPDGFEVDHWCQNILCVNPDHLEPVPGVVNRERVKAVSAKIAQENRTHCKWGHELTEANVTLRSKANNARQCKLCTRRKNREQYLKRKAA